MWSSEVEEGRKKGPKKRRHGNEQIVAGRMFVQKGINSKNKTKQKEEGRRG